MQQQTLRRVSHRDEEDDGEFERTIKQFRIADFDQSRNHDVAFLKQYFHLTSPREQQVLAVQDGFFDAMPIAKSVADERWLLEPGLEPLLEDSSSADEDWHSCTAETPRRSDQDSAQVFRPQKLERTFSRKSSRAGSSDGGNKELKGEARLRINFTDYGVPGAHPQRFGKAGGGIPDGLSGTTNVYDQKWRFHVSHVLLPDGVTTAIKWNIECVESGLRHEAVETAEEAAVRDRSGRTICNVILKRTFAMRASELEMELAGLASDDPQVPSLRAAIESLRPRRCTVGLLFFGLLHESVQTHWEQNLRRASD